MDSSRATCQGYGTQMLFRRYAMMSPNEEKIYIVQLTGNIAVYAALDPARPLVLQWLYRTLP